MLLCIKASMKRLRFDLQIFTQNQVARWVSGCGDHRCTAHVTDRLQQSLRKCARKSNNLVFMHKFGLRARLTQIPTGFPLLTCIVGTKELWWSCVYVYLNGRQGCIVQIEKMYAYFLASVPFSNIALDVVLVCLFH